MKAQVEEAFIKHKDLIPIKTGNLRYRATQLRDGKTLRIIIDRRIAPYADYVDTKGKSAGYWKRYYEAIAKDLSLKLSNKQIRSYDASYKP